ncbi:factor-independent urate hydroxylase [Spirilliplanes yamanashiensis]|uniref:Uricase n=1 Tax=Spirilliplanes yamanashiensis TaxID=42233 RepID=A0A8J3YAR6_9ACTN|nr:urate oxidase [Spirilliplanes yamanashiensis]MDP9818767.1 urate oxidase [Spirilliplanes yamanashiensis]GIJ05221.1 uricase [Spirilliplanes yamanashiensis]
MAIVLGPNRYGKAETRLVHVARGPGRHALTDLNVSTSLSGDLAATHLTGDNAGVLATDSQKNTVYAFAREHGVGEPEAFAARLARHFTGALPTITAATVAIEQYGWTRLGPHSFQRDGGHTRTCRVTADGDGVTVVSGVTGLVLLNTTDSEFHGFPRERYTTLPETTDRVLATAVDARWRHLGDDADWAASWAGVRDALVEAFVDTYSYSLQQTLMAMGTRVLKRRPEVAEIRLALPNRHHLLVDLAPFGLDNPNEVFVAADRPYGLIEGTVTRDDVAAAPGQWW